MEKRESKTREGDTMTDGKISRLRAMLEVASEQGVELYQHERKVTVDEIINSSYVKEASEYYPDFIVKNEFGDIKEIWYGEVRTV